MKKQGSECSCIVSLLKQLFGKRFKEFHKFVDTANEFIKVFSLQLFLNVRMCMYIFMFMCTYICVFYVYILCLYLYMLQCVCGYKWYEDEFC